MSGKWKEVVRLAFKGQRFQDHALDLSALDELVQFQKMVTETAKALWRAANPDRERLPKKFEDRIRLCLRSIEEGSAVAPLEIYIEESTQGEMYQEEGVGEPAEIRQAIDLAHNTFQAIERNDPIPDALPKSLIPEYSRWGRQLLEGESIELVVKDKRAAKISSPTQARWAAFMEPSHQNLAEVVGTILEVDVRQGHFQIWQNDRTCITANFKPEQEDLITDALKKHHVCKVSLKGKGEYSSSGRLLRVISIESIKLRPIDEAGEDDLFSRPVEETLAELSGTISSTELNKLPKDLCENLDHYLYGWPKR